MSQRLRKSRVVKERDPRSVRQLAVLFALCCATTVLLLFSLEQRVELTGLRYRIEELRARRDGLAEAQKQLRLERSALRSLPRVERLARQRLGLGPADPRHMFLATDRGGLLAAGSLSSPTTTQ